MTIAYTTRLPSQALWTFNVSIENVTPEAAAVPLLPSKWMAYGRMKQFGNPHPYLRRFPALDDKMFEELYIELVMERLQDEQNIFPLQRILKSYKSFTITSHTPPSILDVRHIVAGKIFPYVASTCGVEYEYIGEIGRGALSRLSD